MCLKAKTFACKTQNLAFLVKNVFKSCARSLWLEMELRGSSLALQVFTDNDFNSHFIFIYFKILHLINKSSLISTTKEIGKKIFLYFLIFFFNKNINSN
jgi:hypothetical protein